MSEDFLARESAILGEQFSSSGNGNAGAGTGDIDFDRAASAFPDIEGLDGDIPSAPAAAAPAPPSNGFSFDFDEPSAPREVKVTGGDEIDKFESEFPDIEPQSTFLPPPIPQAPTFGTDTPTFAPRPTASALLSKPPVFANPPVYPAELDEEEPEVIKQWREKQAEAIRLRDEASVKKREETISKAERSIDQFYEEYNAKKAKNIKSNKDSEAEYLSSLTDSLSAGTTWSRIATLVELENSQSKTLARSGPGSSDLTRFKEVILRLKREGEHAPGASGY
ncbi:clathrin light chain [Sistotremastrum niveocremeum HHB9708]|uniref:Clathrin light chain n=1 Tax=Sistotremastrum niveocremeum HHB9708 TaxID=1314777 RepID=A0A164PMP9_9AGAM|nr:clathrin light chain [Sistotremastrum niveocremeum HHB9708]